MEIEEKVLKTISKYNLIQNKDKVVIGVSGGPDSMALLHMLYNLKDNLMIELFVAHINHGLRAEADEETEYVKKFCEKIGVPCYIKKLNIKALAMEDKIGTELAGRKARYDFFEEILDKVRANKIATAHNACDNAETVLMNLIRGSGISGLKGIESKRDNKYIRPIIECTRDEIEEYCIKNKLEPRYDKTNMENIYTRNKIRNLLIPYIKKEFNPNIIETINRLSKIVTEEEEYFVEIVENSFKKLDITADNKEKIKENGFDTEKTIVLDLYEFNKIDNVIKSRIVLYTINKLLGTSQGIEKVNIDDIIKLCRNNIGNKYLVPNKNIKIFIKKGKIFFVATNETIRK